MRKPGILLAVASTLALAVATEARAAENVVVSIKPIHSLVAAVMQGVGEPTLIVDAAGSPHVYSMKPSQASALENADLVFWVGPDLEVFLQKPLETLAADAKVVELGDAQGLTRLAFREGGPFEAHEHDEDGGDHAHDGDGHDHEAHALDDGHEHAHDDDGAESASDHDHAASDHDDGHGHDHDEAAHHDDGHSDGHDEHAHGETDMHLWLDPLNARAMVHAIEEALAAADPDNAAAYEANAGALEAKLDALVAETEAEIAPMRGRPFVVFHDAYQYYEQRFGITASGSITVNPEAIPGAGRVDEIREKVKGLDAACVFSEPQFEPKLVQVVTEGTNAKPGVLDPLGAELADGPELYFELIRNMTTSLKTCLSEAS